MEPLLVAHLIRQVDERLVELLRSLEAEDWDRPTIAGSWQVRDVAAHLLDGALRKLSLARDGWFVERPDIRSPHDLVDFINRLNREGVAVYRRLSPAVMIDWMTLTCEQFAAFHESLDPFARAAFSVSWAGEDASLNWFDTARELTERWHHQQQIRLATGREGIMTRELYHPVLDCFMRGLPYALREVGARDGATVTVEVTGPCGGLWTFRKHLEGWQQSVYEGLRGGPGEQARIMMPQEIAWRVFTKGMTRDAARRQCTISGDPRLAEAVLGLTAIVG